MDSNINSSISRLTVSSMNDNQIAIVSMCQWTKSLIYFVCIFSCDACMHFFKRTILKDLGRTYKCKYDKDCVLDKRQRNRCQFCRYQKCVAVGMKSKGTLVMRRMFVIQCYTPSPPLPTLHPYVKMLYG